MCFDLNCRIYLLSTGRVLSRDSTQRGAKMCLIFRVTLFIKTLYSNSYYRILTLYKWTHVQSYKKGQIPELIFDYLNLLATWISLILISINNLSVIINLL